MKKLITFSLIFISFNCLSLAQADIKIINSKLVIDTTITIDDRIFYNKLDVTMAIGNTIHKESYNVGIISSDTTEGNFVTFKYKFSGQKEYKIIKKGYLVINRFYIGNSTFVHAELNEVDFNLFLDDKGREWRMGGAPKGMTRYDAEKVNDLGIIQQYDQRFLCVNKFGGGNSCHTMKLYVAIREAQKIFVESLEKK